MFNDLEINSANLDEEQLKQIITNTLNKFYSLHNKRDIETLDELERYNYANNSINFENYSYNVDLPHNKFTITSQDNSSLKGVYNYEIIDTFLNSKLKLSRDSAGGIKNTLDFNGNDVIDSDNKSNFFILPSGDKCSDPDNVFAYNSSQQIKMDNQDFWYIFGEEKIDTIDISEKRWEYVYYDTCGIGYRTYSTIVGTISDGVNTKNEWKYVVGY